MFPQTGEEYDEFYGVYNNEDGTKKMIVTQKDENLYHVIQISYWKRNTGYEFSNLRSYDTSLNSDNTFEENENEYQWDPDGHSITYISYEGTKPLYK